jgi:hypothetical protein
VNADQFSAKICRRRRSSRPTRIRSPARPVERRKRARADPPRAPSVCKHVLSFAAEQDASYKTPEPAKTRPDFTTTIQNIKRRYGAETAKKDLLVRDGVTYAS